MSDDRSAKPQLPALTGARFLAAFQVVLFHIVVFFVVVAGQPDETTAAYRQWCAAGKTAFDDVPWLRAMLLSGFTAVSFFFTLSGFILAYTCLDQDGRARVNCRDFWTARFARIYPVYLLGLVINLPGFLVWLATRKPPLLGWESTGVAAGSLLLVQSWWPMAAAAWNPPGWSLSVEAFFYLSFPALLLIIDRWRAGLLWLLLVVCWLTAVLLPASYLLIDPEGLGEVQWTSDAFWLCVIKFNPLLRLPEFVAGMLLGKLYGERLGRLAAAGGGTARWLSPLAMLALAGVLAASESMPRLLLYNGLLMPINLVLIYGLSSTRGPLEWLLSRRPMVALGDASYTLYILHHAVILFGFVWVWLSLGGAEQLERELAKQDDRSVVTRVEATTAAVESAASDESAAATVAKTSSSPSTPGSDQESEITGVMRPITFLFVSTAIAVIFSLMVHRWFEVPSRRWLRRRLTRGKIVTP